MTGTPKTGTPKTGTPKTGATKAGAPRTGGGYDADAIHTLEGLEAVRKRPGMYIGGTGAEGLMHLVWELIDNAIDEAAAGFCNRVEVTFHRDRSVEVGDNGRGIPIDKHPKRKVSALEVVLTELHAGGKFGTGAYGASGGLHGVGASVVNALSNQLIAEVDREGFTWELSFLDRVAGHFDDREKFTPGHDLVQLKKIPAKKTGTRIRFWPDWDIFDPDASIEIERVRQRIATMCFLVPGLKVVLIDKRAGAKSEPEEFVARGGLADYVGENVTEVVTLTGEGRFEEKVPVDGKMAMVQRTCVVDVAMRWVKGFDSTVLSFVNTIPTSQGGTHVAGFDRAVTFVINDLLLAGTRKLAKLAKDGEDKAKKEDAQEGLVAVVKVTFPEPQFRGQTKQELGTPAIQSITYDVVKTGLAEWINPGGGPRTHVGALRDKISSAVVNRVTSKQMLEAKRKASSFGSTGMPDKLADCRVHGMDAELIIVEGDSAAGPAKAGRDAERMAILPLRGKVVNAGKSTMKQVLDNAEAQALFTAIGAGQGKDFNLADARYGRVIILCDADVDGSHIRCLLLTLFYHYMRPLLEAGRVYAAQPPLFTAKVGDTTYRAFTDEDKARVTAELTKGNRKAESIRWQRFKGLGEMNVEELAECALDPSTRILRRITMDDAEAIAKAMKMFDVLMGNDVAARKDYLVRNSALFDIATLDV
jgi:DNA gyrase subunit B